MITLWDRTVNVSSQLSRSLTLDMLLLQRSLSRQAPWCEHHFWEDLPNVQEGVATHALTELMANLNSSLAAFASSSAEFALFSASWRIALLSPEVVVVGLIGWLDPASVLPASLRPININAKKEDALLRFTNSYPWCRASMLDLLVNGLSKQDRDCRRGDDLSVCLLLCCEQSLPA